MRGSIGALVQLDQRGLTDWRSGSARRSSRAAVCDRSGNLRDQVTLLHQATLLHG
jgi:hypothetical protein